MKRILQKMMGFSFLLLSLTLPSWSQTYDIPWKVIDIGGAPTTSTNYIIMNSIGQSVIGVAQSTNYNLLTGYWQTELGVGVSEKTQKEITIPRVFFLNQSFPNPTRSDVTIHYGLPRDGKVTLEVFDILGRSVKTLVKGTEKAGFKKVTWDGRDERDREVTTGIYFFRLTAGGTFKKSRKLIFFH